MPGVTDSAIAHRLSTRMPGDMVGVSRLSPWWIQRGLRFCRLSYMLCPRDCLLVASESEEAILRAIFTCSSQVGWSRAEKNAESTNRDSVAEQTEHIEKLCSRLDRTHTETICMRQARQNTFRDSASDQTEHIQLLCVRPDRTHTETLWQNRQNTYRDSVAEQTEHIQRLYVCGRPDRTHTETLW